MPTSPAPISPVIPAGAQARNALERSAGTQEPRASQLPLGPGSPSAAGMTVVLSIADCLAGGLPNP